jgi:hypothetical protein
MARHAKKKHPYRIALSFAGENRGLVSDVADYLSFFGVRVFYDEWERHRILGEDLYTYLAEVYQNKADYCAMFISRHYVRKVWPRHERKFAYARALSSKSPYILPIRLDDTSCPGLAPTIAYVDGRRTTASQIAVLLLRRLGQRLQHGNEDTLALARQVRWEIAWNGTVKAVGRFCHLYVGRSRKRRLTFTVWSPGEHPLVVSDFRAFDSKGRLRTRLMGKTARSREFVVAPRKALAFGEAMSYTVHYRCPGYFADMSQQCRDSFNCVLPTKLWGYDFVFPRGAILEECHIYRKHGRRRTRHHYSTTMNRGRPVVSVLLQSPIQGTTLEIDFRVARPR